MSMNVSEHGLEALTFRGHGLVVGQRRATVAGQRMTLVVLAAEPVLGGTTDVLVELAPEVAMRLGQALGTAGQGAAAGDRQWSGRVAAGGAGGVGGDGTGARRGGGSGGLP